MNSSVKDFVKIKFLTLEELIINLDRLSRFKLPEDSFSRVFNSVILKNLIYPKYSQKEIENFNSEEISVLFQKIWNESVYNIFGKTKDSGCAQMALISVIKSTFKNIDANTETLLNTHLNIFPVLKKVNYEKAPINLKFLIKVNESFNNCSFSLNDLINIRMNFGLKYPIRKLIIAEGITEEILLPVFASKLGCNFDKEGIYIIGSGGKSKSPSLYLKLKDKLNIPIVLLFDSDAKEICQFLQKQMLRKDKILIIENGEFEDILSINLLKRSLNGEYMQTLPAVKSDFHIYNSMCENIEYYYKSRHLGEFKKAKLSKIIAGNVKYKTDITDDIKLLIKRIL